MSTRVIAVAVVPVPRCVLRDAPAVILTVINAVWALRNRWRLTVIIYQSVLGVTGRLFVVW